VFEKAPPYKGKVTLYSQDCCHVIQTFEVGEAQYYNAFGNCAFFKDLALHPIMETSLPFTLEEDADQHGYRGMGYIDYSTEAPKGEVKILRNDGTILLQCIHLGCHQHYGLWEIHKEDGSVIRTNMGVILTPLKKDKDET